MNVRSQHLARILISRMRELESALLDDAAPDASEESLRRQELVAKVLLAEEAITDAVTVQLVCAAMPRVIADIPTTDREMLDLAKFLDAQLKLGAR